MKLTRTLLISALALTPMVSISTPAFAGQSAYVTGTVLKVDREARTLVVRKDGSDETTTIFVPENQQVALSSNGNTLDASIIPFERAHRGIRVKMLTAPAANTALIQAK
jgi:hypothetical protein